jgi:alginate O-acetyltransferase complex protein AlgI
MNVASLEWVLGLLIVSACFFHLPRVRHRQTLFSLCSFAFLAMQSLTWSAWVLLLAFLVAGYGSAKLLSRRPSRLLLAAYLSALIGVFVFVKQYSFLTFLLPGRAFEHKFVLVGLSYMLFRQIHFVVDAYQGQIQHLSLWNYVNYQLNLFGLLAGPIQRYQDFCEDWLQLKPICSNLHEVLRSYLRVFVGVIKVLGIGNVCLGVYSSVLARYLSEPAGWRTVGAFVLMLYLFVAYLYFNFSGYCDIVIGGASLLGLRMPENFNYPFVSRNIGDLWTRWHRTLGFWIRDYLFTPLFKSSVERWPSCATLLSFAAYFVAFTLAGLWHGSTWNFLVFGLLHGSGVASAKLWEMFLIRRRGRAGLKLYLQNSLIKFVAIVATIHYFSFTLIFWYHGMGESRSILKKLGDAIMQCCSALEGGAL